MPISDSSSGMSRRGCFRSYVRHTRQHRHLPASPLSHVSLLPYVHRRQPLRRVVLLNHAPFRSVAPLFGMIGISSGVKKTSPAGCLPRRDVVQYPPSSLPSVNKGKHACHRAFSALFSLFALACASKPASQKPKITRKTIADRCEAVWPEQKCVQTRKGPQGILAYCQGA